MNMGRVGAGMESPLDPALAERLQQIYRLSQAPRTLLGLRDELDLRLAQDPRIAGYLERVRRGEAVIGAAGWNTPYSNVLEGRELQVMCGYDAIMNVILRGGGLIRGRCVHCEVRIEVHVEEQRVLRLSSPDMLFWLGAGPIGAPGNPVCDHLHLFPSREHLDGWLRSRQGELGVALSVAEAVDLFADRSLPPKFAREATGGG